MSPKQTSREQPQQNLLSHMTVLTLAPSGKICRHLFLSPDTVSTAFVCSFYSFLDDSTVHNPGGEPSFAWLVWHYQWTCYRSRMTGSFQELLSGMFWAGPSVCLSRASINTDAYSGPGSGIYTCNLIPVTTKYYSTFVGHWLLWKKKWRKFLTGED